MQQEPVELSTPAIEYLAVLGPGGERRLLIDRLVNPSGHYVLTVSTGDDVELFQLHTVDSPEGPRSPLQRYVLSVSLADGSPLLELTEETLRLYGEVEQG